MRWYMTICVYEVYYIYRIYDGIVNDASSKLTEGY